MKTIKDKKRLMLEADIHQDLNHPNIVKLYEVIRDGRFLYLAMELCYGGDLLDYVNEAGSVDEKDAAKYMQQLLSAAHYLHSSNLVHRDIKLENVLLTSDAEDATIKLIDFGHSRRYKLGDGPTMRTKVGTAGCNAPEVLSAAYDEKCDIWSCGVAGFAMLCGVEPFGAATDGERARKVRAGNFKFPEEDIDISDDAKEIVTRMLIMNPKARPSAKALLQHQWFAHGAPLEPTWVRHGMHIGSMSCPHGVPYGEAPSTP